MMMKRLVCAVCCTAALAGCGKQESAANPAASAASAAGVPASAPATALAGTDIRNDNIGGDFTLTDGKGQPFALGSLKGKVVLLSFGFTHCPDVCPSELLTYNETVQLLGDAAKDVAVVFVSVDPERDTPELIGKYVAQFNPDFIGLTDTDKLHNNLAQAKMLWRIVSAKAEVKSDTLYNVDHTSGTYLLDKNGNAAYFEPFGVQAPQMAADIRKLLAQ